LTKRERSYLGAAETLGKENDVHIVLITNKFRQLLSK
jgi:hypothetical protein